jgi:hypothetical protein
MKPHKPPKYVKMARCPTTGKVQHRTRNGALVHLVRLTKSRAADGITREAYLCQHCGTWHVGTTPGTRLADLRPA